MEAATYNSAAARAARRFAIVRAMDPRAQTDDTERLLGELIRLGRVTSVDLETARCVVEIGDDEEALATGPIPWAAARAGAIRVWAPPSINEQVVVCLPEGDIERAFVLGALWTDAAPPPVFTAAAHIVFSDGAVLEYDPDTHRLTVALPAGGQILLTADAGVQITGPLTVTGDVEITGDVAVTGQVEATVDVIVDSKSVKTHTHTNVQSGGALSGPMA